LLKTKISFEKIGLETGNFSKKHIPDYVKTGFLYFRGGKWEKWSLF